MVLSVNNILCSSYQFMCSIVMITALNADGHRQRIINWIDGTGQLSAAFDFTTKGVLQVLVFCEAIANFLPS